jgi:hypothetical protein
MQLTAPARTNPAADPALRLEASSNVPAPVAATLRRACFDCHSNDTRWPWYSRVAPTSWLVVHDVNEGRGQMNFSHWGEYNEYDRADMLDEACKLATSGRMPLRPYLLMHRDAQLSREDLDALCAWTRAEIERITGGGDTK